MKRIEQFEAAFRDELRSFWFGVSDADSSIDVAVNYVGARYGHPGYDWSVKAARELARNYAQEYGEVP